MDEIQGASVGFQPDFQPPVAENNAAQSGGVNAPEQSDAVTNAQAQETALEGASEERYRAASGFDAGAFRRFQLESAVDNQAAGNAPNIQVAQAGGVGAVQAAATPEPPAARGLLFSETKGASSLAYTARQGEVYRFPDGKEWQVAAVHQNGLTGFRAIELQSTDPADQRRILAFAGTDPTSPADLITDVGQAGGLAIPFHTIYN
jgi:hypothetical protein